MTQDHGEYDCSAISRAELEVASKLITLTGSPDRAIEIIEMLSEPYDDAYDDQYDSDIEPDMISTPEIHAIASMFNPSNP